MKSKGFTLMELMIVIAIVGILVAVVLPSYRSHVLEAQSKDTQGIMLQMVEQQENFYLNFRTYTLNLDGNPGVPGDGLDYATNPFIISYNGAPAFSIRIENCLADAALYPDTPGINRCFRLIATPLGDQVEHGGLIVDNRGRKILDRASVQPEDWNGNILPAGACPECAAFP